jgi:hypothetical protein
MSGSHSEFPGHFVPPRHTTITRTRRAVTRVSRLSRVAPCKPAEIRHVQRIAYPVTPPWCTRGGAEVACGWPRRLQCLPVRFRLPVVFDPPQRH